MIEDEDDLLEDEDDDASPAADAPPLTFRAGRDLTSRLDRYLVDRVGHLSRAEVQRLIKDKLVSVNGRPAKASYNPREGDAILVHAPPPKKTQIEPEPIPLDILYEDDHLLAINKQADLIIHPARGRWHGTLVNGLIHYAKQRGSAWSSVRGPERPGILHRLDRNTTGVMLVAKSDEAHWRVARQFENRTIQKTYLALAHGVPELTGDLIDVPIGTDKHVRERMAPRKVESGGKAAQTQYGVEESWRLTPEQIGWRLEHGEHAADRKHRAPPPGFSLFRLKPLTGRTHQLRVHLSVKGWPIVGDTMYGGRVIERHEGGRTVHFARQALHAAEITFAHPRTLAKMTVAAPLPADVVTLLEELRRT